MKMAKTETNMTDIEERKIGDRIKEIRKEKGLTLKQLSEMLDLSIGYLSNLERNLNSPTLDSLQKICESLEINIVDLLEKSPKDNLLVTKDERRVVFEKKGEIRYEMVNSSEKNLKGVCIIMEPGANYKNFSWGHNSDELGVVIKGMMKIDTNDNEYILNEGDSLYIPAHTSHSLINIGKDQCISYWFNTEMPNSDK
ncbi:transcriptional regulator, XRE family with cupin sensor [Dethiosulfatibacter aminovorans DSM 17477]|uniref:Transcriptional regulator, XRE family with cupin sensor n=2 Tax=Dethiosulfatibacter TaxID=448125 RepID=A0A1M6HYV3_9FIRM|nr:transcriptional regulator, XRE family with cupin sensor [Dethiosulfatibacter aminovorans DSM 17477]